MPEVIDAGISTNATPPENGWDTRFELFGSASGQQPEARVNFISPEYLTVLHIPLAQGRLFDHTETMRGAPLALINQTMARQYWPNGNAIGQQVKIAVLKDEPPYSPAASGSDGWLQIVGVVSDVRDDGLRNPIKPPIYVPYTIKMRMFTQILVRTRVPPLSILHDIRARLVRLDREQQVMQVRDLEAWITGLQEYSQQRFIATLFGVFSVLALVLAAVGLYSVVSYGVATRTDEFGIRRHAAIPGYANRSADVYRRAASICYRCPGCMLRSCVAGNARGPAGGAEIRVISDTCFKLEFGLLQDTSGSGQNRGQEPRVPTGFHVGTR